CALPIYAAIAVGVWGPVERGEHRTDSDGVDCAALGDQVGVVVARQLGREIILLEDFGVGDGQQGHAGFELELAERASRLAGDQDGGGYVTRFDALKSL